MLHGSQKHSAQRKAQRFEWLTKHSAHRKAQRFEWLTKHSANTKAQGLDDSQKTFRKHAEKQRLRPAT